MQIEINAAKAEPAEKKEKAGKPEAEDSWKTRLSRLPQDTQAHIARKYYGGLYPWKG